MRIHKSVYIPAANTHTSFRLGKQLFRAALCPTINKESNFNIYKFSPLFFHSLSLSLSTHYSHPRYKRARTYTHSPPPPRNLVVRSLYTSLVNYRVHSFYIRESVYEAYKQSETGEKKVGCVLDLDVFVLIYISLVGALRFFSTDDEPPTFDSSR